MIASSFVIIFSVLPPAGLTQNPRPSFAVVDSNPCMSRCPDFWPSSAASSLFPCQYKEDTAWEENIGRPGIREIRSRTPCCLVAVRWCRCLDAYAGRLLVSSQALRRSKRCDDILGVSRNAVLVEVEAVLFALGRDTEQSHSVHRKHDHHRNREGSQGNGSAADC